VLEPTTTLMLNAAHILVAAEEIPVFGYELIKRTAHVLMVTTQVRNHQWARIHTNEGEGIGTPVSDPARDECEESRRVGDRRSVLRESGGVGGMDIPVNSSTPRQSASLNQATVRFRVRSSRVS
jgi:hypothetical protein